MCRPGVLFLALVAGTGVPGVALAQAAKPKGAAAKPAPDRFASQAGPFLTKYCAGCHGATRPKGDLSLAAFSDDASVLRGRKVWAKVKENVEGGDMPPEGKPQPPMEETAKFLDWVKSTLAQVDCTGPVNPGRVTLRRLNRAEYNNTIRDLVGLDFHPADDFPSDDVGYGFDNIGDVLTIPPILFEKYLDAAEAIAARAIVAGPSAQGEVKTWEVEDLPDSAGGSVYNDVGRVLASTGTIAVSHTAPREGEYLLRARAFGQQAGPEVVKMAFVVDGKPAATVDVPATEADPKVYETRVRLTSGPHKLGVAFLNDYYNEKAAAAQRDRNLVVDLLEVQGPIATANAELPESHRRILFRTPTKETHAEVARAVVERFATHAFRRPVAPGEVARLVKFVDLAEQNGESFERGVQVAVQAVLVSPHFLFRVELDQRPQRRTPSAAGQPDVFPISDFELASRLTYFLWSSMPDDELFRIAQAGRLRQGDELEKQVRRMLRDPKAQALVENFVGQWLQTRNLKTVNPDRGRFPAFDEALRSAMRKETELYFGSIIRDDRSILDVIDADYTFVNERLAKHYGIAGVKGDQFRKVKLTDGVRGGVLTQASVLTVTSNPTRTSPVKRGKWILEQILGTPPPPPPSEVPPLADDKKGPLKGTLRVRMEQHRANPSCASCHAKMDPLGFGFENFDAVGAWRDRDGGDPVDPSGELPSGQKFRGPKELKQILKSRKNDVTRCLAEKLLTYALGRGVEYYDTCALDAIVEGTAGGGYKFSRLVVEVVKSDPFQKRKGRGSDR
jgi:mono/diheme cytochrome c family protein